MSDRPPEPGMKAMFLSADGVSAQHYCCGPWPAIDELAARFTDAKVAEPTYTSCCRAPENGEEHACAFDVFCDADDIRAQCLLSEALARAEGRSPRPFTRRYVDAGCIFADVLDEAAV